MESFLGYRVLAHYNPKVNFNFEYRIAEKKMVENCIQRNLVNDGNIIFSGESGTGKKYNACYIIKSFCNPHYNCLKIDCGEFLEGDSYFQNNILQHSINNQYKFFTELESTGNAVLFIYKLERIREREQTALVSLIDEMLEVKRATRGKVKIISTCHENPCLLRSSGKLIPDLYNRLEGLCIGLTPVRERFFEIRYICDRIINEIYEGMRGFPQLNAECIDLIKSYSWPGNFWELHSMLKNASLSGNPPEVDPWVLRHKFETLEKIKTPKSFEEHQKQALISALKSSGGKIRGKSGAAEILQIKPTTLEAKLKKLGINKQKI